MWILYAFGSAFFAGLTAILAKIGIKKTDSTLATAIRTVVVLLFTWVMVFIVGSQTQIGQIDAKTFPFPCPFRFGHRGFMALLFQSFAAG